MTEKDPVQVALDEARDGHAAVYSANQKANDARTAARTAEMAFQQAATEERKAREDAAIARTAVDTAWLTEEIRAVPDMVLLGTSRGPSGFGGVLALFFWAGPTPGTGRILGRQYHPATIGLGVSVLPTWDSSNLVKWRVFAQARHASELRALMAHAEVLMVGNFQNIWDIEIPYGQSLAPDHSTLYRLVPEPVLVPLESVIKASEENP